jgi:ribosomal 50S subunit-associated protein YjgA (DUF615 family)
MHPRQVIQDQLTQLKEASQQTQEQLGQLEQQQQQLAQQHQQAVQTLIAQRGAIQSAESMLKKLDEAEQMPVNSLPPPTPVAPGAS